MAISYSTMDDITELSNPTRVSAKNTIDVTRNTEMRPRTVLAILVGLASGGLLGYVVGSLVPIVGIVYAESVCLPLMVGVCFLLFAGRVRDRAADYRWRRLHQRLRSRKIDGGVFYPNSVEPVNLVETRTERFVVWLAR